MRATQVDERQPGCVGMATRPAHDTGTLCRGLPRAGPEGQDPSRPSGGPGKWGRISLTDQRPSLPAPQLASHTRYRLHGRHGLSPGKCHALLEAAKWVNVLILDTVVAHANMQPCRLPRSLPWRSNPKRNVEPRRRRCDLLFRVGVRHEARRQRASSCPADASPTLVA